MLSPALPQRVRLNRVGGHPDQRTHRSCWVAAATMRKASRFPLHTVGAQSEPECHAPIQETPRAPERRRARERSVAGRVARDGERIGNSSSRFSAPIAMRRRSVGSKGSFTMTLGLDSRVRGRSAAMTPSEPRLALRKWGSEGVVLCRWATPPP